MKQSSFTTYILVDDYNPLLKSVKHEIIRLLAKRQKLSAKEVYELIKSSTKFNISYKYVYKLLTSLVEKQILVVEDRVYSLHRSWIVVLKEFVDEVHQSYEIAERILYKKKNRELLGMFTKKDFKALEAEVDDVIGFHTTAKLDEWYSKHYDPENKEYKYLKEACGGIRNKRILELGCGTGRITRQLLEETSDLLAVDRNKEAIKYAQKTISEEHFIILNFLKGQRTLSQMKPFDIIISGWTGLHYLKTDILKKLLRFLNSRLTHNGKLILVEAYHNTDYVKILDLLTDTKNEIKEHKQILKDTLVELFADVQEKTIMTEYIFDTYEELETAFKIELEFEENISWSRKQTNRLKKYVEQKTLPYRISEAPSFYIVNKY